MLEDGKMMRGKEKRTLAPREAAFWKRILHCERLCIMDDVEHSCPTACRSRFSFIWPEEVNHLLRLPWRITLFRSIEEFLGVEGDWIIVRDWTPQIQQWFSMLFLMSIPNGCSSIDQYRVGCLHYTNELGSGR